MLQTKCYPTKVTVEITIHRLDLPKLNWRIGIIVEMYAVIDDDHLVSFHTILQKIVKRDSILSSCESLSLILAHRYGALALTI